MVKKIKTVKQLKKHIGETLHVVSHDGYEFDATVETESTSLGQWPILKTDDKVANRDCYWWKRGGKACHHCEKDSQITVELTSLTTIADKKARDKKRATKYLTKAFLDAARGHFCLLEDGSKGFICTKTDHEEKPVRVLHNCKDIYGWTYEEREMDEDNAPETIKRDFTKAYNIWSDSDASAVKVVEVLEKYDGRKYRHKKAPVKDDDYDTLLKKYKQNMGRMCEFKSGCTGKIIYDKEQKKIVAAFKERFNTDDGEEHGWPLEDYLQKDHEGYKYGWYIPSGGLTPVKFFDEKVKAAKATKFLTASEIKAGVGHFCKMSDGSEGFIVWTRVSPRILLHQQQNGLGWGYDAAGESDDNATAPESFRKQFEYGWNINDEDDAKSIKVVEILDAREKSVDESPKKTLLDMTIREVLEKLDEIIKR